MYKIFPLKERVDFMKKLSFLLCAGIPFTECLHFIIQKERNKRKKEYLKKIILKINSGILIHKSFDTPPFILDKVSLRIIKNSEATGSISKNCHRLAILLEEKLSNQNRLIGVLLYPLCIVVFAFILILILLFFIFPKIIPIIGLSGSKLPLSTRILLFIFNFLSNHGIAFVFSVGILALSFVFIFKKNSTLRMLMYRIIRLFKISDFAKEMSLFLESGYSMVEALDSCFVHENNPIFKEGLRGIIDDVKKGIRFSKSLEKNPLLFGYDLPQFVHLGEESGGLSKSILYVSTLYDEEIKNIEKKVFVLLEPTLMLVLGLIVGFIALSLIAPIYSITSSINAMPS